MIAPIKEVAADREEDAGFANALIGTLSLFKVAYNSWVSNPRLVKSLEEHAVKSKLTGK